MEMIGAAAARGERVLARLEKHADYPGTDGGYAVDDSAFDESLKWIAQSLEKVLVEHAGNVVGDDEYDPSYHRGHEHRHRAVEVAGNRDQHADEEKRAKSGVAFEGIVLRDGDAIGDEEGGNHDDDQESAHKNAGLEGGAMRGGQDAAANLQRIGDERFGHFSWSSLSYSAYFLLLIGRWDAG